MAGLATVLLKGRVRAAGLRRRRHDWQTEEAKVRGVRRDVMVVYVFLGEGVVYCDMRYAQMFTVVEYPVLSGTLDCRLRACGDYVRRGVSKPDIGRY
jgi:hypothetical protein